MFWVSNIFYPTRRSVTKRKVSAFGKRYRYLMGSHLVSLCAEDKTGNTQSDFNSTDCNWMLDVFTILHFYWLFPYTLVCFHLADPSTHYMYSYSFARHHQTIIITIASYCIVNSLKINIEYLPFVVLASECEYI